MLPKRRAIAIKYNVESVLNLIDWVPETFHGFAIDPDAMVDMLFLHALDSFENCSYYPELPVITDRGVLGWFRANQKAVSEMWHTFRVPWRFSGNQASYLRLDNTVWIHYLY